MKKSIVIYSESGMGMSVAEPVAKKHKLRDGQQVGREKHIQVGIDNARFRLAEIKAEQEKKGGAK